MKLKRLSIFSCVFFLCLGINSVFANNLILIVDSSHFMNAVNEKTSNMGILKPALTQFIDTVDPSVNLGMIVSGNSRKKGCERNIYQIPVGPLTPSYKEKLKNVIYRLKPLGENAITEAVLKATAMTDNSKEKTAIVIVGCGRETCTFSPCDEVANRIAKSGCRLYTVGIFPEDADTLSQYACFARVGNGTFYKAESIEDVLEALTTVSKELNSNLKVNVFVTPGHLYEKKVSGSLYMNDEEIPYQTDIGNPLFFSAMPGIYKLSIENIENDIRFSKEMFNFPITGEPEKSVDIHLNMGKVQLDLFSSKGKQMTGPVTISIYNSGEAEYLTSISTTLPIRHYLLPGTYDFLIDINTNQYKNQILKKRITVQAGKVTRDTIYLDLGQLNVTVFQFGNVLMPGNITTKIFSKNAPENEFFRSVSHPASILLPPGNYTVEVDVNSSGYRKTVSKNAIRVTAGETRNEYFDLALGKMGISVMASLENVFVDNIKTTVYPAEDKDYAIATSYLHPASFFLPPGKYDAQIDVNTMTESIWKKGIPILPGKTESVIIKTDLKLLEIKFGMGDVENVHEMVDTSIFSADDDVHPVVVITKNHVKTFLPQGTYSFRFDLYLNSHIKKYWKKNIQITSENYQSFNVTFPDEIEYKSAFPVDTP